MAKIFNNKNAKPYHSGTYTITKGDLPKNEGCLVYMPINITIAKSMGKHMIISQYESIRQNQYLTHNNKSRNERNLPQSDRRAPEETYTLYINERLKTSTKDIDHIVFISEYMPGIAKSYPATMFIK